MGNEFFRRLSEQEEEEFRQWARDNFTPGDKIDPLWHPVVREECQKMEAEAERQWLSRAQEGRLV